MIRFQAPELPRTEVVARYFALAEEARWYSNSGPCYHLLVDRLQTYLGPGVYCVPMSNCTLAISVGLRALVGARPAAREVILPSFTFAATALAVRWAGLEPVFVDVEPYSWHMDANALDDALRVRAGRACAVLACSTFGAPPPRSLTARWERSADAAGIPLLIDSAAGFGSADEDGVRLGRQGHAEIFSFHATKPFAIGEGGLLVTRDPELALTAARLANFGFSEGVIVTEGGLNAKMAEWPAATALAVLDRFEEILAARREKAAYMLAALEDLGFTAQVGSARSPWQFVPVRAPTAATRKAVLSEARADNIEIRTYYDVPLHEIPSFADVPVIGELTETTDLSGRILSLPMANDLTEVQIEAILLSVRRAVSSS